MKSFTGEMYRVGLIRYVDVPASIAASLKAKGPHVSVRGTVNGADVQTTLVSRGGGLYRMAIHSDVWKKQRLLPGMSLRVVLRRDLSSREPALPRALVLALRDAPHAKARFEAMTTALRRQIVRYLTSAKQQATLERRVAAFVRRLDHSAD